MPRDPAPPLLEIGGLLFDPRTGELRRGEGAEPARVERLAPQPARLLELLISKRGELVTREEIRRALWPESHVDFDQGLNFCVRQIRAALDDRAGETSWIETLPRRGYRLRAEPLHRQSSSAETGSAAAWHSGARVRIAVAGAVVLLVALVAVSSWRLAGSASGGGESDGVRLAIMPFELAGAQAPNGTSDGQEELARISEWLVAELAGGRHGPIAVLGPRSTARFSAFPFPDLRRLRAELGATHVLNARYFERDGRTQLIVELIRLADGDHPWAEFFPDPSPWLRVAETVRDRVVEALANERPIERQIEKEGS